MNTIEPLEARIAPAILFTFSDLDGDLVTVTTSKGTNGALAGILIFSDPVAANPRQLWNIDFSQDPTVFAGTSVSVTARARGGGDGLANVGFIDASTTGGGTAIDLGAVSIGGDLGRIRAGDGVASAADVKSLSVRSLGRFGIASITIKGIVSGTSAPTNDHFGFTAAQIGSFKASGFTAKLTPQTDAAIPLSLITADVAIREV